MYKWRLRGRTTMFSRSREKSGWIVSRCSAKRDTIWHYIRERGGSLDQVFVVIINDCMYALQIYTQQQSSVTCPRPASPLILIMDGILRWHPAPSAFHNNTGQGHTYQPGGVASSARSLDVKDLCNVGPLLSSTSCSSSSQDGGFVIPSLWKHSRTIGALFQKTCL